MAKKKTRLQRFEIAYRGSISTIIVTVMLLFIGFFLPLISANQMQLAREGKGRYIPEEMIIWDWKGLSDFENVQYSAINKDELGLNLPSYTTISENEYGIDNSIYWYYHSTDEGSQAVNIIDGANDLLTVIEHNTFEDMESETVVDNYGIFTFIPNAKEDLYTYPHNQNTNSRYRSETLRFYLKVSKDEMIELQASKIKMFADYDTTSLSDLYFNAYFRSTTTSVTLIENELMEDAILNIFELDLNDLISIASMSGDEGYLLIELKIGNGDTEIFTTGSELAFDIQIHGLVGKSNAINILSVWFMVEAIFTIFLGIVMLPQLSIGEISKFFGFNSD